MIDQIFVKCAMDWQWHARIVDGQRTIKRAVVGRSIKCTQINWCVHERANERSSALSNRAIVLINQTHLTHPSIGNALFIFFPKQPGKMSLLFFSLQLPRDLLHVLSEAQGCDTILQVLFVLIRGLDIRPFPARLEKTNYSTHQQCQNQARIKPGIHTSLSFFIFFYGNAFQFHQQILKLVNVQHFRNKADFKKWSLSCFE